MFEVKRKIFLVRHGESADKQHGQSDLDRVLTTRGKNSIERLGKFFKEESIQVDSIVSSPSQRTKSTSHIIANAIDYSTHEIDFQPPLYNGTDQDYLDAVNNSSRNLLIVGHNPAISFLIGKITGDYSISLSPGQCAILELDDEVTAVSRVRSFKLIGPFHE